MTQIHKHNKRDVLKSDANIKRLKKITQLTEEFNHYIHTNYKANVAFCPKPMNTCIVNRNVSTDFLDDRLSTIKDAAVRILLAMLFLNMSISINITFKNGPINILKATLLILTTKFSF